MSLFYGTDKKVIRQEEILGALTNSTQFKWHELLLDCRKKGVTDTHFRTYMAEKNSTFSETDVFLFDCMKEGILSFRTNEVNIHGEYESPEGEQLDDTVFDMSIEEPAVQPKDNLQYKYFFDTDDPRCERFFDKFLKKLVKDKNVLDVYAVALSDLDKTGVKVDGFKELVDRSFKKLGRDLQVYFRNHLDGKVHTENLNGLIERVRDSENAQSKNELGNNIMDELKNEVRAHRGHSVFYAVFHPINYYREYKCINNAKDALVQLGSDREKVDEFVENIKEEDRLFRASSGSKLYGLELLLDIKFEHLRPHEEIRDLDESLEDGLAFEDDSESVDDNFEKNLKEDVVGKDKIKEPIQKNEPSANELKKGEPPLNGLE